MGERSRFAVSDTRNGYVQKGTLTIYSPSTKQRRYGNISVTSDVISPCRSVPGRTTRTAPYSLIGRSAGTQVSLLFVPYIKTIVPGRPVAKPHTVQQHRHRQARGAALPSNRISDVVAPGGLGKMAAPNRSTGGRRFPGLFSSFAPNKALSVHRLDQRIARRGSIRSVWEALIY